VADVPVAHDPTLYLLLGDWFAWIVLATLFFTLVQLYRLRRNPHTLRKLAAAHDHPPSTMCLGMLSHLDI